MSNTEFLKHLRDEKLATEEVRANYTFRKLAYATALLGAGSLSFERLDLSFLLYLVPFVAIAFDLYILAEDYSVKRIGAFLGASSPDAVERHWEKWIAQNRDRFAPVAMPVLTILLTTGAAFVIWFQGSYLGRYYWPWLIVSVILTVALFVGYWRLRTRTLERAQLAAGSYLQPFEPIGRLRSTVARADHILNETVYDQLKDLFTSLSAKPEGCESLEGLTPEYGKAEFFVCVDSSGRAVLASEAMLESFREIAGRHPDFELWFQETLDGNGEPVLLVGRWLCHLVGLRHRSVHLFIDHPTNLSYTLVQVRSFEKFESPGLFDLPAAGHVVDLETAEDSLFKELEEELDWRKNDILDLKMIGSYNYAEPLSKPGLCNVEYRLVFRSRLKGDGMRSASFSDGEVAAISVFAVSEIRELIKGFPERVASGLLQSFPVYAEARGDQSS